MLEKTDLELALNYDVDDEVSSLRKEFYIPQTDSGNEMTYLCGNSLGLQSKASKQYVEHEIKNWQVFGVEGHFKSSTPWYSYHESVCEDLATLVGAQSNEVIAMNSLSVNLHLMMVSFYRPTPSRYKIVIEANAFPSDRYAVMSQLQHHGFSNHEGLIEIESEPETGYVSKTQIQAVIEKNKDSIALVLLPGVQYLSGQCLDLKSITALCQQNNIYVGYDLAHSVGNTILHLHDWHVDFAVWCSYKYLNSGPGGIAGCFVHEKHCQNTNLNRFSGWWGNDPDSRFSLPHEFVPQQSADGWQLSNPPIFQLASLKGSLETFAKTSMPELRNKADRQVDFLVHLLQKYFPDSVSIITPLKKNERGNQLSLKLLNATKLVQQKLIDHGVITDFREPDVLRVAVTPLYNSFKDCYDFIDVLHSILREPV